MLSERTSAPVIERRPLSEPLVGVKRKTRLPRLSTACS